MSCLGAVLVNVVHDGRRFRMFYFGSSLLDFAYSESIGGFIQMPGAIGLATSPDGVRWSKVARMVLSAGWLAGEERDFDAYTVGGPSAVVRNGRILLWYMGGWNLKTLDIPIGVASLRL